MQSWLAEPFTSCLLADAEKGCNLGPGAAIGASLRYLLCKRQVACSYRPKGLADGPQVSAVGVGRSKRFRLQAVEPSLGIS